MAPVNPYAAWFTAAHREWADLLATDPSEQLELERRWQQHQAEHHRPPADPTGKGDNITLNETGKGTSAAYLAARLKKAGRDDLLEQIGPGKQFSSMRAAAIEAGIIKPVPTVRITGDIPVIAARLCQHLTREQRIELIDLLAPDL